MKNVCIQNILRNRLSFIFKYIFPVLAFEIFWEKQKSINLHQNAALFRNQLSVHFDEMLLWNYVFKKKDGTAKQVLIGSQSRACCIHAQRGCAVDINMISGCDLCVIEMCTPGDQYIFFLILLILLIHLKYINCSKNLVVLVLIEIWWKEQVNDQNLS